MSQRVLEEHELNQAVADYLAKKGERLSILEDKGDGHFLARFRWEARLLGAKGEPTLESVRVIVETAGPGVYR